MWAKIDDEILDDEKVASLGPLGFALYVAGIVYASRNLTDGRIPVGKVRGLLDFSAVYVEPSSPDGAPGLELGSGRRSAPDALAIAEVLVELELWALEGRTFEIVNFLKYNPTREKVLADREGARTRMAKSRARRREGEVSE